MSDRAMPTANAFVATVLRSRLVDGPLLTQTVDEIRETSVGESAASLAGHLVSLGLITRFQAEKLLAGSWQGLAVGPYRILCPIGRGGTGIVYLSHRLRPKKPPRLVAVKLLSPKRAATEPRTLARFVREMEIGQELPAHPHLTRTLETGVHESVHILAMEYIPGSTVRQVVQAEGALPVHRAARVFADAAAGLHAMHQAGYIHRDLKPANIVITSGGRAKVLDFGFALRRGERPDSADPSILGGRGYTLGTMDFLPPEQAVNAVAVGAETDVYSLGCSLYFAVAGRNPFPEGSAKEKIRMHRAMEPLPLNALVPALPDDFARLVRWMIAKKPEQRPQAMELVERELNRWADPVPRLPTPLALTEDWEDQVLREVEDRWLTHHKTQTKLIAAEQAPVVARPLTDSKTEADHD